MSFSAVCASKTKGMTRSLLTLLLVLLPAELAGLKLGRQPWQRSLSQEAVSPISRRAVFQYAVLPHLVSWPLFLVAPRRALADGADSKQHKMRARAIYGSRIFHMQDAPPSQVLEETNAFRLFATGVYRGNNENDKLLRDHLLALHADVVEAATRGDAQMTKDLIKTYIAVGQIEDMLADEDNTFDPSCRRTPGGPPGKVSCSYS